MGAGITVHARRRPWRPEAGEGCSVTEQGERGPAGVKGSRWAAQTRARVRRCVRRARTGRAGVYPERHGQEPGWQEAAWAVLGRKGKGPGPKGEERWAEPKEGK